MGGLQSKSDTNGLQESHIEVFLKFGAHLPKIVEIADMQKAVLGSIVV